MKTKTRTLIVVCSLGIIGLMNINAISDNKKEFSNENSEMSAVESMMTDEDFSYSAQDYSTADINNEIASFAATENLPEENTMSDEAFRYSAQAFSTADIENEIDENAINQILPEENQLASDVIYSAKAFSDYDFESEIKNRQ